MATISVAEHLQSPQYTTIYKYFMTKCLVLLQAMLTMIKSQWLRQNFVYTISQLEYLKK